MKISRYHPICLPQCASLVMRQRGQAACRLITAASRPTLTARIGGSGKTLRGEFQRGSASARSTADSLRLSALVLLPIIACVYPCYKPASTRQLVNRVANELMRVNELHARRSKGVGIRLGRNSRRNAGKRVVGATGLEPATSTSRTWRASDCATPRHQSHCSLTCAVRQG